MSWFQRLKEGLSKSSNKISDGITSIISKRKLDDNVIAELEELLITSDMGVEASAGFASQLAKNRFDQEITPNEIKLELAQYIEKTLISVAKDVEIDTSKRPFVILVVGVNGSGKTTTIGKLANYWKQQGKQVRIVAADTFRAAAVQQLEEWGVRAGVPLVSGKPNTDSAGLCFDALSFSVKANDDILIIDTAGRLQNKSDLMAELEKIPRVIQKIDVTAPHCTLLVLDANTGQNAYSQIDLFSQAIKVSGLVMNKLDGTAKGGVLVGLAKKYQLPIYAIGVGEGIDDLRPFSAAEFAQNLVGLETLKPEK